jgi:uncharacterized membrane protein YkvA (DUF1232 family)
MRPMEDRDHGGDTPPADLKAEAGEPHPLAGLGRTLTRLPRYLILARGLVGDRRLSRWRKAALGAGIAYLASPIDLVPGLIPVVGQLDDLAAVLLALRFALRGLSGPAAEARLAEVQLSRAILDEDLASVRRAAGWVARRAAAVSGSALNRSARLAAGAGRLAGRAGMGAARAGLGAARAGLGAARTAGRAPERAASDVRDRRNTP